MNTRKAHYFPYLLVFFEMATYLSSDMYLPALPSVMKEFAITATDAQLSLTTWFLGAISMQLILGPISDRYGRKSVLCVGGIIFALATLGCATAKTYSIFLICRFIQGTGICFMAVPGYASIHESHSQKDAIRLIAIMAGIAVLAPAFGPLLGSVIMSLCDWRGIFWFLTIWSFISMGLLMLFMPETLSKLDRSDKTTKILKTYWNIITNKKFMFFLTINGLIFCGFITWIVAGPFLVIEWFKQTPLMFGIYQGLIFLSYIMGNFFVKKLIDKKSSMSLIQSGLNICLIVSLLSTMMYLNISGLWMIIVTYIIFAFGSAFAFAPLNRLTIESSSEPMGARMAIFSTGMSGFATLSSLLVSVFYKGSTFSLALIILVLMLLAMILSRMMRG